MKVKLLRDADGPNPDYSHEEAVRAYKAGDIYDIPHTIVIPAGTILDHPDAHIHCQHGYGNEEPLAEPVDDQAKARYKLYLANTAVVLEQLKRKIANADPTTTYGRHLWEMGHAYGVLTEEQLDELDDLQIANSDEEEKE